jgi:hypothetical protein
VVCAMLIAGAVGAQEGAVCCSRGVHKVYVCQASGLKRSLMSHKESSGIYSTGVLITGHTRGSRRTHCCGQRCSINNHQQLQAATCWAKPVVLGSTDKRYDKGLLQLLNLD